MGLGELWLELLKFYCQGFDSSRTVISIRHDGKLTRAAKNWRTKRLAIEGEDKILYFLNFAIFNDLLS